MRLYETAAGKEAWYSALARNVRLQLTRFEIGESDVFTLSGNKQAGKTVQQFRTLDYEPAFVPDMNVLLRDDTIAYEGDLTDVGFWKVRNNDGGLIFRVPVTEQDMTVGNIRIYAKNTGPYPFPDIKSADPYRQYQDIYDNDHGGEVLLFVGINSVADVHWKAETMFPHFVEVRLAIHADGLFNIIDRDSLAFEANIDVLEVEDESELDTPTAKAYGCAVIRHHSATDKPAVAYRTMGTGWFGLPLHGNYQAIREDFIGIADSVLDNGLLDYGSVTPPAIVLDEVQQGVVIQSQPFKLTVPDLAFTQSDVESWTAQTAPVTVNLQPNTLDQYTVSFKIADLAFLGLNQQLYLIHNTTRYRLLTRGMKRSTPPIIIRHGDTLKLEGTVEGPISSLTGYVYSELNENPITADPDNIKTWFLSKISMHVTSAVATQPPKLDFGLVGRRIAGYTWDEYTPEQRVGPLGYDLYGFPKTVAVTIRVVPSQGKSGGTGYTFGNQQTLGVGSSYLPTDYKDAEGKAVIRRGVTGLSNTFLKVYKNGVEVGTIADQNNPEGSVTFNIQENDRLSFRASLEGRAHNPASQLSQILPAVAVAVEGVTAEGFQWLKAEFDLAATFGPDTVAPTTGTLPTVSPPTALTNVIGINSFSDLTTPLSLVYSDDIVIPSLGSPFTVYGEWITLMGSPNPTISSATSLTITDLTVTGSVVNGFTISLEKFTPRTAPVSWNLATQAGVSSPVNIGNVDPADTYRVKAVISDPNIRVQLTVRVLTEFGNKDFTVDCRVRSS